MNRTKNEKSCDEVFTEYLLSFMNKTNKKYFLFMLKFILLFREFYDISGNKDKKDEEKMVLTNSLPPNGLPDLCNDFYEFMENNDFFEMNEDLNEYLKETLPNYYQVYSESEQKKDIYRVYFPESYQTFLN